MYSSLSCYSGICSLPLAVILKFFPVQEKPIFDFLKRFHRRRRKGNPGTPRSGSLAVENGTADEEAGK